MFSRPVWGLLAVCLLAVVASAQNAPPTIAVVDPAVPILNQINDVSCILYSLILYCSGAIAALLIMLAGIGFMTSEDDPAKRDRAKTRVIYAVAGMLLVIFACPLVDYLVTNTKILPFQRSCDCLAGHVKATTTTTQIIPTTTTTTIVGTTTTTGSTTTTTGSSSKILIYSSGSDSADYVVDFNPLKTFLESQGHPTDILVRPQKVTSAILSGYKLVFIAETTQGTRLDQAEIDALITYNNNGGALVLSGEGDGDTSVSNKYIDFVNDISIPLGVTYASSVATSIGIDFCEAVSSTQQVTNGVSSLSSTGSDSYLSSSSGDVTVAASFNGKPGIMVKEASGKGRVVFDGCFLRFGVNDPVLEGPGKCDNNKYILNILSWAGV
jgi:hypothetical protein